ncbi:wax ester/triacylglycerol synthase family O-acyltransferase, partial [Mycobacterium tuberculosis]|uniref:wax ester/triacylglycerol synthase family O-acyltransferase n=1 Tax=Mycobacterium tuberculosis TaxID=1773 RepID=UPI001F2A282C
MSQTARRLGPQDMFFLYSESSTTMMHVGALMPFTPPSGAPPDLLRQLVDESKASEVVEPWSLRLSHPELLYHPTQSWVVDDNFDLDYHVRRSALASPGDERELGIPVSRLHSHALDLRRPPWEVHFIEGLEGGRFAIYIKMHHSLITLRTLTLSGYRVVSLTKGIARSTIIAGALLLVLGVAAAIQS